MPVFFGANGTDFLIGSGAADTIFGGGGNDTLNGGGGNDNIYGDLGNDSLIGGPGLDFMYGGEGDDTLDSRGAGGNDNLFGGIGNDVYQVDLVTGNVVEGSNQGIDTVRSLTVYTLGDNVENLVLLGGVSGTGNNLNNQITASNTRNTFLSGLGGNDTLSGLGGNDTLTGAAGNDILNGGAGIDQFLFDTALPGAGVDTINDFVVGTDKIVLDKTVFTALETLADLVGNPLVAGDFSVINVAAASEATIAGTSLNEIVYNRLTGSLFYNPNNNVPGFGAGGGQFATIVGSPDNLSNTDILVRPLPPVT